MFQKFVSSKREVYQPQIRIKTKEQEAKEAKKKKDIDSFMEELKRYQFSVYIIE